jgi:hypothetical protein
MAIYHRKVNGRKVWWVRVNHKGLNASPVCDAKEAAKLAESDLLQGLKRRAEEAEQHGQTPATIKALFEVYGADLEARGKGSDTVGPLMVANDHCYRRQLDDLDAALRVLVALGTDGAWG